MYIPFNIQFQVLLFYAYSLWAEWLPSGLGLLESRVTCAIVTGKLEPEARRLI